jgi:DNA-directed RNA polymerase subunit D
VVIEVKVIDLAERYAKFTISGMTPASANALRRCMINEIPRMAIDEVNFYENTSVLFDEQLALRAGGCVYV